ncbi:MAG: YegP family protein [Acidimicrobiales bacterium]
MADTTEVYQDDAGGWRWRRLAPNGEIIATSGEAYTREHDAWRAAHRVFGEDGFVTGDQPSG